MFGRLSSKAVLLVILLMLFVTSGCSGGDSAKVEKKAVLPPKVKIGVINSKTIPPQVVYGFQQGIYKKEFPEVEFEFVLSKGHHDVAEKMGAAAWDLMYLGAGPAMEFVNYGYEHWSPAKYTVLAGAQYGRSALLVKPEIKSMQDLDGKVVGITNKNHDKEMVLNKVLAEAGLKTEALGGTVKVKYGESVALLKEFEKGTIKGFYPMPSMVESLKNSGNVIISDGTDTEFGKQQTFSVFAASNQFLAKYPDFVREMVRIHVDNTELAQKDYNEMIELTYQLETEFFKDDPQRVVPKDELAKLYKRVQTTYDPNIKYLKDSHKLMTDAKYIKAMPAYEQWADFTMLNEVLKEKGLPPVK